MEAASSVISMRREVDDGAEGLVVLPLGRRLVPVGQPVLVALVLQPACEHVELFRRFLTGPVGGIPAEPPRPCPAALVRCLFDETVPGELAQMERAEAGAVAETGGGLRGRDGADLGEQVQQGDA